MGRVDGKVALVTGVASDPSLGRSTAVRLAQEGAKLIITDVDEAGAENCAKAIRDAGGEAIAFHQDVTDENRWKEIIAETGKAYGQLDVLVNNAGIAVLMPIADMTLADWNKQIEVNLTSVFLGCKYAMPAMKAAGGGSIVNLSSIAGLVGIKTGVAYCASKGGVRIMSKAVALEGAEDNIRCNTVHPGVIWTNMQAQATGETDPSKVDVNPDRVPLARVGLAEDIANCILYLSSDEANYVTGAEFTVDGGMTTQ